MRDHLIACVCCLSLPFLPKPDLFVVWVFVCRQSDMPFLAERCLNNYMKAHTDPADGSGPALTALDELRGLILQNDLPAALQHANVVIDLRWFMAHLVDLLRHAGALDDAHASDLKLEFGSTLHEYWLLEYSSTLMCTPMWQLAVNYLSACDVFGRSYLRTLVSSQPLTSDIQAFKLAHICDRFGLKTEKHSIYQQMGMTGSCGVACELLISRSNVARPLSVCVFSPAREAIWQCCALV